MVALRKRRCILKHKDWRSEWTSINTGLPQGSPLSPVLFNIYTLDLARVDSPLAPVKTFADDVLVSAKGKTKEVINSQMHPALSKIERCCEDDGNHINGEKANALFCTLNNRMKPEDLPTPVYGGTNIELSSSLRYLGVVLDSQLNFTEHINCALQRATKGISALRAAAGRRAEERHLVMLYKSLVRSIIDYALPMLQLSQNQLNRVESMQNTCLRIITGCTRSTPIPVLLYLVGITSIKARQDLARATIIAKALQQEEHGLHKLATEFDQARQVTPRCTRTLRTRAPREAPVRRLHRRSWIDLSFEALRTTCQPHSIADQPMWSQTDCEQKVVIRFNRECREWDPGRAEAECTAVIRELSTDNTILIATDGSFSPDMDRAGWGFAAFQAGNMIEEQCGAHSIYTSSTRMEVEAVRRALNWLYQNHPDGDSAIIATDSMALLSRVQSGWVPDGWKPARKAPIMGKITWMYVPGHAGVVINEKADQLAAACTTPSPLSMYHPDVQLLGNHLLVKATTKALANSSEGCRLLEKNTRYGSADSSRRKGPDRCQRNQISTGNISRSTLQLLLQCRDMGEESSVTGCISADPCFAGGN